MQLLEIQVQNFGLAIDFATRRVQLPIEPCLKEGEIDPEEFELFLQKAVSSMRHIKDQEIVMVVGNTDGGKSTLLNRLFGCQLTVSYGLGLNSAESFPELFESGNEYKSQISYPQALTEPVSGLTYCDCPVIVEDDRMETEKAVSALSTYLVTKTAKSIKTLIVVLPATAFRDQNGKNLKNALKTINQFLGSNLEANQNSILFVITKAPPATTSEQVGEAIHQLLVSVTDIEVRQMLKFMLDHQDNIFIIDALDTSSQTQDQKEAFFSRIMESRGIATDDFIYVPEDASKNQLQGFILRVLEDIRVLMTSYFDLQNNIQRSEERLKVVAQALEEVNLSINEVELGKLAKERKISRIIEIIINQSHALEKEETKLGVLREKLEAKETNLRELDTSEELEHKELIYPNPSGSVANGIDSFFMLERHAHTFKYEGTPFTRVEVQCEGSTHSGIGNLFRLGAVPGSFFRGLFGDTSEEEVKAGFKKALGNVRAILDGPYDEFTKIKSDPEAGVYEGIYSTLHYGITPKATITVYGEKRHHPEYVVEIKFIREDIGKLQKDIDEKKQDVGNIKSEIARLEQQLVDITSDIDKYHRDRETRKVELETELRSIQRFLPDEIEQASQKKKEIESLQQRFRSVFFLLGCIDVAQVFSIPEASLDAFQEQYTRFYGRSLPMIRRKE